jgi:tetratricopeptide (TPR) repeat protein
LRLKAILRASVAAVCIVATAAPAGFAEGPPAVQRLPGSALAVSVAQSKDFSRIEFRFAGGARMTSRRKGQTLVLRFSRYAKPDMTRLRVDPPRWLKGASDANAGGLEITLNLADGADAKVGEADGAAFVNLFAKKDPAAAASSTPPGTPAAPTDAKTQTALSVRPDPTPASGVVKMQAEMSHGQVLLHFAWKNPLGAAVFRRGDAVWVVFDAPARIDVSATPHGFRQVIGAQAMQGPGFSAVRLGSPSDVSVSANAQGALWTIALGSGGTPPDEVKVTRDDGAAAGLAATMAGATRAVWIDDPVVGDRMAVVTAMAPSKGLPSRREYVDLALLPTAQGLAVESVTDGVSVTTDGDVVSIGSAGGLKLSPRAAYDNNVADNAPAGLPQALTSPGLIDFDTWGKTGSGGFLPRYDALQRAAADEAHAGAEAPFNARMGLVRFLVGSQLSYEAIGVLNLIGKSQQNMLSNAEYRALRGAAKAMAGRYAEAQTDFSMPVLADDPASSLWRGYIDAKLGQWTDARKEFDNGQSALFMFPAKWRSRFAVADAQAATALQQYPVAEVAIDNALRDQPDAVERLSARLAQADLLTAQGQQQRALGIYQAVSHVNLGYLSAPALLHATEIQLALNQVTPLQAAAVYDGLRYRWRGDATELETIRSLGQIYLSLGRYREALEALRSAGQRLPALPEALELQNDLSSAFNALFLGGQADGMQPVQALALFYDFKELTPIGADGDLMVRKLARRLVDVDLLTQAADLLKYQADNRLNGVPRAEVSTDLAVIDLMNRQPEAALDALNSSRTTLLPNAMSARRRTIEARAWLGLGQYDHALEVIQSDKGGEADAIRAEVIWKKHDWMASGSQFEKLLGDRYKAAGPLNGEEEARLLRAAIAYSLAGDETSLNRLRGRYEGFVPQAHLADALRVSLSSAQTAQMATSDFTRVSAEDATFVSWVKAMKQGFRDRPAPTSPTSGLTLPPANGAAPTPATKTAANDTPAKPSKG